MLEKGKRIIFLSPDWNEVGGVQGVSRMALSALLPIDPMPHAVHEAWSLGSVANNAAEFASTPNWRCRSFRGSKLRAGLTSLYGGLFNGRGTLVIVMHAHLAPLALPMIARGARLAIFLHGVEVWERLNFLRAFAFRKASILIANSQFTARGFVAANPEFAKAQVTICPLGISDEAMAPCKAPEIPPLYALIVGRLAERYKGHDLLMEVWPQVTMSVPSAFLVVAGDGVDRVRLERKANALGIANRVKFMKEVTDSQLAALYSRCAFFVMPSTSEGFGLVFLEAMRAGKACIGAQGAAEEVIIHGETGFIVDVEQKAALTSALIRLFTDPEQSARLGEAGHREYVLHFKAESFQRRLLEALKLAKT